MPIVIKEIRVTTTIEKKIVQAPEISEDVYRRLVEKVVSELEQDVPMMQDKKKNDR